MSKRAACWASLVVVGWALGACAETAPRGDDAGLALDASAGDAAGPPPDGAQPDDAGDARDAGTLPDAAAPGADAGGADATAPGADGGGMSGMACMDLLACCGSVGANLQQTCIDTASAGDEARCSQILGIAMQLGACVPGGTDAGPAVDAGPFDAGPIGPVCSEYLACCPELGALAPRCQQTASMGDETACGRSLDLARRVGRCLGDGGTPGLDASLPGLDASLPDLGLPSADAALPDLGLPSADAAAMDPDAAVLDPDAGADPDASLPDA